jgi:hypothetical protein
LNIQLPHIHDQREIRNHISNRQTTMRGEIPNDHSYRISINLRDLRNNIQIVIIAEIEKKHIVCLTVDTALNRVRLVRHEGCEQAQMSHAGNCVVPVSFVEVKVSFLGE